MHAQAGRKWKFIETYPDKHVVHMNFSMPH